MQKRSKTLKLSIKKFKVGVLDDEQQTKLLGGSFGCTEATCGGTANGCNPPPSTFYCTAPGITTPGAGCSGSGGSCNTVGPQVSCLK